MSTEHKDGIRVEHKGWIGVDLDGTLAEYDHWRGAEHIGAPISAMVDRVKRWIALGQEVRIFTARVSPRGPYPGDTFDSVAIRQAISRWCIENIGVALPITCTKDYDMVQCWDDRAVQVQTNTGRRVDGSI